jgi:hypothetical protein
MRHGRLDSIYLVPTQFQEKIFSKIPALYCTAAAGMLWVWGEGAFPPLCRLLELTPQIGVKFGNSTPFFFSPCPGRPFSIE